MRFIKKLTTLEKLIASYLNLRELSRNTHVLSSRSVKLRA